MAPCSGTLRLDSLLGSTFGRKPSSDSPLLGSLSPLSSSLLRLCTPKFPLKTRSFSIQHSRLFICNASSSSTTVAEPEGIKVSSVPTKPIEEQKTGTSGLRKKVKVFMQENYLANWIQALFNSLPPVDYKSRVLVLGGDGRYFNKEAAQLIICIAT
ncbi:hypothetical protein SLA2020_068980 [Shorea laevis]